MACDYWINLFVAIPFLFLAAIVAASLKMANVWQKFVILRIGKVQSVKGSGMFVIVLLVTSETTSALMRKGVVHAFNPLTYD